MRKSRFTEAQIIGMLPAGGGFAHLRALPEARLEPRDFMHAESQVWWDGAFRRKAAEAAHDENAKLKRLLADAMLDNVVLKDLLGKP
ncbi:putative transposase [Cereibacter changlensis]|uniref:Putative transposase n=1 Tax=Cereibacter changlensis TaxID=402884 RepID=A0A2W7RBE2_9RHOB|nr:putative transposase [Cereibacter changlensis]